MPYPMANSDAVTLANAAINEIESYESADLLNIKRLSDKKINSVEFRGREIRTSTVRFLASYSPVHSSPQQTASKPSTAKSSRGSAPAIAFA